MVMAMGESQKSRWNNDNETINAVIMMGLFIKALLSFCPVDC